MRGPALLPAAEVADDRDYQANARAAPNAGIVAGRDAGRRVAEGIRPRLKPAADRIQRARI